MKDEISRVLTLVEEGKIDKEKASELITILQGKNQPELVTIKREASYGNKMLKIRVTSQEGDNVNVNLPINLVKAVLKVGTNIAEKIPEAAKYVKDINVDLLIEAIENELDGEIVNITSANGDKVFVVIEQIMLKVKLKVKDKRFSIPVPYGVLNLVSLIITSKKINRLINKAIEKDGSKFIFPEIERKDLKPLLQGLQKHSGVIIVETKLKDGTEVEVKL